MNLRHFMRSLPAWQVSNYKLGEFWPETGNYEVWKMKQLEDFAKRYVCLDYEACSTNSGGTILFARGLERKRFEKLYKGLACPECYCVEFKGPDETAIHLSEQHHWPNDKATVWLREKIEEDAFYDEP